MGRQPLKPLPVAKEDIQQFDNREDKVAPPTSKLFQFDVKVEQNIGSITCTSETKEFEAALRLIGRHGLEGAYSFKTSYGDFRVTVEKLT